MSLSQVSLLFLVQLAFGSALTLVVDDRRALGPKYLKVAGWILVALYGLALTLVLPAALADGASGAHRALAAATLLAALALLGFASVAGWDRPRLEALLLWTGLAAGAAVVLASALHGLPGSAPWTLPGAASAAAPFSRLEAGLVVAGAFASALVLGFTTFALALGHWYLVAPGLPVKHLARLVTPLPWLYVLQLALSGAALWLMWTRFLGPGARSVDDLLARHPERMLEVFTAWTRLPVGLLVPLVLAFLTKVTVRMQKTQPATGILYAMTVLVYLGDLMGKLVQGGTGVPL